MVNLESIDPLKVDFRVPEIYMKQVQVGQSLRSAASTRCPGKTYEGKVSPINPLVDAAGRAIVIRAQVRNQDTSLRPGMFARVRLITKDEQDALVAAGAGDGAAGRRAVRVPRRRRQGRAHEGRDRSAPRRRVEVIRGVAPGETVVTAGQMKIRDGAPVTLAAQSPSAGASGRAAVQSADDGAPPAKPTAVGGRARTPQVLALGRRG